MSGKKIFFLLILLTVLTAVSTTAWLYLEKDIPRKTPVRATQVFLMFCK